MAQKQKLQNSGMQIPDDAILRIAQAMLPLMQQYFESEEGRLQRNGQTEALEQKEAAPALQPAPPLIFAHYFCVDIKIINPNPSLIRKKFGFINNGDPYGNRTRGQNSKKRWYTTIFQSPCQMSCQICCFLSAFDTKKFRKSCARFAMSFCARCVYILCIVPSSAHPPISIAIFSGIWR